MQESFRCRDEAVEQLIYRENTGNEAFPKKFFSFQYNGQMLNSGMLKYSVISEQQDAGFQQLELLYDVDPELLRLRVKVKIYYDFPVIEYFPFFENYGSRPSGLVENFNALDLSMPLSEPYYGEMIIKDWNLKVCGRVKIRYNLGSNCQPSDFFPQEKVLYPRFGSNELTLRTDEGRSSVSFMPFFGIDLDDQTGYNVGIGWSGGWRMTSAINIDPTSATCGTELNTTVSMLKTCFKILPGESLRQVGAFIQFRKGMSVRDAQNVHRHFMVTHHAPYDSQGELIKPPLSLELWGGLESDGMIDRINIMKQHDLPYEVCWIDAGWTGKDAPCPHFCEDSPIKSDWFTRIGQWRINRYAHPDGLAKVSDAARAAGLKTMVWFEPERISSASESSVLSEHLNWLLPYKENQNNFLLDLGNPEALSWIIDIVTGYFRSEKIDHFRQDFNMNPLPFWEENDTPDRVGVHENEAYRRTLSLLERNSVRISRSVHRQLCFRRKAA